MPDSATPSFRAVSVKPPYCPAKGWADSALLAWCLAAAAFVLAAFCLDSLAWDGSYYLIQVVQNGVPMAPHRRWFDLILFAPVAWAQPLARQPLELVVLHGLLCAIPPLFSLAVCLRMLRGVFAPLRFWIVLGILLAPLPGQIVFVSENNSVLQLAWVCLAFVWCGCPWRWAPAVLLAGVAMVGLHPVSAPLFFFAAVTAAVLSFVAESAVRGRLRLWAGVFGLAFLGKVVEILMFASPYEREHLHGSAWAAELSTGFLLTPALVLGLVWIEALRSLWASCRPQTGEKPSLWPKVLWGAAFVLGIAYCMHPWGWCGALGFRKFGIVFATPLVLMGGVEAWRHWQDGGAQACKPVPWSRSTVVPALLFALLFGCMSLSWKALWGSLQKELSTHPATVQTKEDLLPAERFGPLDHWSTSSLSLLLQGWNPTKVHISNRELQLTPGSFCICPGNDFVCEDKRMKLGWLKKLVTTPPEAEKNHAP